MVPIYILSPSLYLEKVLLDDNRRITMAATIDAVWSRVTKERQKKTDKGMSLADLTKELGSEEAHKKKACMKEVKQAQSLCKNVILRNQIFPRLYKHVCWTHTVARICESELAPKLDSRKVPFAGLHLNG